MEACDCCGKRVDERSMASVAYGAKAVRFMVCQACRGMYDDEELLEKCEEQAESGKPDSITGTSRTRRAQNQELTNEIRTFL
jgi:hypothetical protein